MKNPVFNGILSESPTSIIETIILMLMQVCFNNEQNPSLITHGCVTYIPKRNSNQWKSLFMSLNAILRVLISGTTYYCLKLEHILFFHKTKRPQSLKTKCKHFWHFNSKNRISLFPCAVVSSYHKFGGKRYLPVCVCVIASYCYGVAVKIHYTGIWLMWRQ